MSAGRSDRSRIVDLGTEVHYRAFGGPSSGSTVVLVHGLGGSHLDWELLVPKLTGVGRVLALDLPGFGLSEPTGRPATVDSNVRVLEDFVTQVAGAPVLLVGNSMGGLICVLLAARMPALVRGLVLLDPALPAPPATGWTVAVQALPGVGERLRRSRRLRIGPPATVLETLERCGVEESALPPELFESLVKLVARQSDVAGADRACLSASRSLTWALIRSRRYHAAMGSIMAPVLLIHGDQDQLVPVRAARAAARSHPRWRYVELRGVGHTPQLQAPDLVGSQITGWLRGLPEGADTEGQWGPAINP